MFLTAYAFFHRLKKERMKKKVAAENFHKVYEWTKVILVQKAKEENLTPEVKIEKMR